MKFVKVISPLWLSAIATGIMIGTSYIPFPPWAILFAWVPLWLSWSKETSLKRIFWSGWLAQFIFNLIGFHWIWNPVVEFGHMPKSVGALALIAFAAGANIHVPIAGVLWRKFFPHTNRASLLGLASLSAMAQVIFPQMFDWLLGYTLLWGKLPAFHFADLIGFEGLTVVLYLFNGHILWVWTQRKSRWLQLGLSVAAFATMNIAGFIYARWVPPTDANLKVLMVQANIGNFEKFMAERDADFRTPIVEKFFELTRKGLAQYPQTELITWPETAFPSNLHPSQQDTYHPRLLRSFIISNSKPLLTGGYFDDPATGQYYNSLYYFGADGNIQSKYDKTWLLAFGEYLPGSTWFPFLKKLLPEVSDFGRGPGPTAMPGDQKFFGPQICYEGLFPYFVRGTAKKGAQILVNVTNDSWFMHTFESKQHLFMTLARAIEVRRPLVRTTNTGISSAITAMGDVLVQSPQETEWYGLVDIPYWKNPPQTVYSGIGYYFSYVLTALLVAGSWIFHARKP